MCLTSQEATDTGGKITPKKKTRVWVFFLLSVLTKKFSSSPTCYAPKEHDGLSSEEYEPPIQEFSHKMRGLKNNS